ncbi:MAG: ATP-binding cassette domain-containing protein [Acutalibacteraceae bacterium]
MDGVSFSIEKGECIGLVGESGCGKSTIARMVTHLEQTTSGEIFMNERNVTKAKGKELRNLYQNLQMVFQNPSDSFNPRIKLGSSIGEVLINFGKPRSEIKSTVVITGTSRIETGICIALSP